MRLMYKVQNWKRLMFLLFIHASQLVNGQNAFEKELQSRITSLTASTTYKSQQLYPTDAIQGMMIPSGWGGSGKYIYFGFGGVFPQIYSNLPDMMSSAGFCIGNPEKAVNVAVGVNMLDVSNIGNFSGNISVSRSIGRGSSISVGGIQLLASEKYSDAPEPSYFVSFSHSVQSLPSSTPGLSKLTYTIGAGTGRYYLKSNRDRAAGKGRFGTAIFGGLSYAVMRNVNLNAEWDGLNLGTSLGIKPLRATPLSVGLGVFNLTNYAGDKPRYAAFFSYAISLSKPKY